MTKLPPGFKDDGHGDFYVWSELMLGTRVAASRGFEFDEVVLVTDDTKKDWSTKGTPHPILCSEMRVWANAAFDTWSLGDLQDYVKQWQAKGGPGDEQPATAEFAAETGSGGSEVNLRP